MTTPEQAALAAVVIAGAFLAFTWWKWPPSSGWRLLDRNAVSESWEQVGASRRRDPRATTGRLESAATCRLDRHATPAPRDVWSPPPYDWRRRPGARHDLDLRHVPLLGRHTARRDLGFLAWPASRRP